MYRLRKYKGSELKKYECRYVDDVLIHLIMIKILSVNGNYRKYFYSFDRSGIVRCILFAYKIDNCISRFTQYIKGNNTLRSNYNRFGTYLNTTKFEYMCSLEPLIA